MRKVPPIFILAALILFEAIFLRASICASLSPPQQTPQDERAKARSAGKDSGKIEVEFEGNKVFSSQQLLDYLKQVDERDDGQCFPSKKGSDNFDFCLRDITSWMRSKGYVQAKLGEPKKEQSGPDLKIIVPVEEGLQYRLGEIRVENSKLFSPKQIIEIIEVKSGEIANVEVLGKGLEKIWRLYADRGYFHCSTFIDPIYNDSEGIVDFVINMDEASLFTVTKIEFEGDTSAGEEIGRALLLREGDIYSEQLFQESLKNINQLSLFEEVFWRVIAGSGRSSGVELLANEKTSEITIKFNLKKKDSRLSQ